MKIIALRTVFVILLFGLSNTSYGQGQGQAGKFGMGISNITTSGDLNFVLTGKYWMTNAIALSPRFGFVFNSVDQILLGGSLYKSITTGQQVDFYIGGRGDLFIREDPLDDLIILGGIIGAEYFVVDRFSVAGESNFLIVFDEDTIIETSATLSAIFYFN